MPPFESHLRHPKIRFYGKGFRKSLPASGFLLAISYSDAVIVHHNPNAAHASPYNRVGSGRNIRYGKPVRSYDLISEYPSSVRRECDTAQRITASFQFVNMLPPIEDQPEDVCTEMTHSLALQVIAECEILKQCSIFPDENLL